MKPQICKIRDDNGDEWWVARVRKFWFTPWLYIDTYSAEAVTWDLAQQFHPGLPTKFSDKASAYDAAAQYAHRIRANKITVVQLDDNEA